MARTCAVCNSSERREIDKRIAAGASLRDIAGQFRVSKSALARHKEHVAGAIVRAAERKGERLEDGLLEQIRALTARAWALLDKLEADGDFRGAVIGLRETRECVVSLNALLAKATEAKDADGGMCSACQGKIAAQWVRDGLRAQDDTDIAAIRQKLLDRLLPENDAAKIQ